MHLQCNVWYIVKFHPYNMDVAVCYILIIKTNIYLEISWSKWVIVGNDLLFVHKNQFVIVHILYF